MSSPPSTGTFPNHRLRWTQEPRWIVKGNPGSVTRKGDESPLKRFETGIPVLGNDATEGRVSFTKVKDILSFLFGSFPPNEVSDVFEC